LHNSYEKYKDKYRTASIRLKDYDYSQDGAYFITICTKDRKNYFGDIYNEKIKYSLIGEIAKNCWVDLPNHFQFIELGEWVVMPNHMHGIVFIYKTKEETLYTTSQQGENPCVHKMNDSFSKVISLKKRALSTEGALPAMSEQEEQWYMSQMNILPPTSPKKHTLSSIVRSYKSAVSKKSRSIDPCFSWQPRFYERVIRNEHELFNTSEYIIANPSNWMTDDYYHCA
jgi:REP element-mobilizing transposase RayT